MTKPYRFRTKEQAELAYEDSERARTLHAIALHDMLRGKITWLKSKRPYRIGLVRLDGPAGGVVVVVYKPQGQELTVSCAYLEEWARWVSTRECVPQDTEGLVLRELGQAALEARRVAINQGIEKVLERSSVKGSS